LDLFLGIGEDDFSSPTSSPKSPGIPYLYARVSSARQETDGNLDRQIARLESYLKCHMGRRKPYHLIREYGSGLNPLRPGLRRLIRAMHAGKVSHVLITYSDRLTRFGFPFLEWWFAEHHVPIILTEPPLDASMETAFVQDIMAILSCFSGKLYKTRALHTTREQRQAEKILREFNTAIANASEKTISDLIRLFAVG
jgi:putative resolvase